MTPIINLEELKESGYGRVVHARRVNAPRVVNDPFLVIQNLSVSEDVVGGSEQQQQPILIPRHERSPDPRVLDIGPADSCRAWSYVGGRAWLWPFGEDFTGGERFWVG